MSRRWTEERIRRELEAFLPGFEAFPPYPVFRATGRRGLWQAMARRGGPERFAEEYGLPYKRNDRAITRRRDPRTPARGAARQRPSLLALAATGSPSAAAPSWSPRSTAAAARAAGPTSSASRYATCAGSAGRPS